MSMTETRRGIFITFEGMDGSGKSTQMRLLAGRLRSEGREVVENYEPGGTPIGLQIRRILLDSKNQKLCPMAELLLYFASRAQALEQQIRPAFRDGKIVLSDRYTDSTMAYQGVARGLGRDVVNALHEIACGGLRPDLTLLLDVDPETSLARAYARNQEAAGAGLAGETRMDDQALEFHRAVHEAYARMAREEPARFAVIDGRCDVATVAGAVWEAVSTRLAELHV